MKLWMVLYAMIWLAFVEFLLVMTPGDSVALVYAHITLGIIILGLAYTNAQWLRATKVPARVKRIAKSTFSLTIVMAVLGILILLEVGKDLSVSLIGYSILDILVFFHVVNAFAILTQAAATAISYDMWEDREFEKETEPGVVPAAAMPKRSATAKQ